MSLAVVLRTLLLLCCLMRLSLAAAVEVVDKPLLDFGRLALGTNEVESVVRLRHRGQPALNAGGHWRVIAPGLPARLRLRELPPLTSFTLQISQLAALSVRGQRVGEKLRLDAFVADEVRSDARGEAEFMLGAALLSSGSGIMPRQGVYEGAVAIELSYWSEPLNGFVRHDIELDVTTELASMIAIREEASLDFGRIVALSAADGEAALRLGADGRLSARASGGARLQALEGASPGRIQISGAAPLQVLTLRFEPPQIRLKAVNGDSGTAEFIVDRFETAPQGLGFRSDGDGNLSFSVGARLRTEQGNRAYAEGTYEGQVTLEIDY